jgi:hypothetical protein
MPYDGERVMQLRNTLREARKQKLSAGLKARREKGRRWRAGAASDVVGIWRGAISGSMKVSFQAARSIG